MEKILENRIKFLVGDSNISLTKIKDISIEKYLERLKNNIFLDLTSHTIKLEVIRNLYKDVFNSGIAFNDKDSKFYNNIEILKYTKLSLEYIYINYYNKNSIEHTNWWQWEIGYPLVITDILTLFYKVLRKETIKKYLDVTKYFLPTPYFLGDNPVAIHPNMSIPKRVSTGGNRVDNCKICFLRGVLNKDKKEINDSLNCMEKVWETNLDDSLLTLENRDGFYNDGSFIQHGFIPYVGTYGNVLLRGVGEILFLVKNVDSEDLCKKVYNSFEPLLYKGSISDIVNGRAISRKGSNHNIGHEVLNSILLLSKSASPENSLKLKSIVKREVLKDKFFNHYEEETNSFFKNLYKEILNDNNIKLKDYNDSIFCFHQMNRIFRRNEKVSIGIALQSNKIGNYETCNGENTNGWYTGDGAIYIDDTGESYIDYWHYLDYKYIPGTTEILEDLSGLDTSSNMNNMPINTLAQCEIIDNKIYAHMNFTNWNKKLTSYKSYIISSDSIEYSEKYISCKKNFYSTIENKKLQNIDSIKINGQNLKNLYFSGKISSLQIDNRKYIINTFENVNIEIYNNNKFIKVWVNHTKENTQINWKITI